MIAAALVAALTVPGMAYALPGRGKLGAPSTSGDATRQAQFEQRMEALKQRVEAALKRRSAAFEGIASRVRQRIERVTKLADKIEAKGGDVSAVRTALAEATRLLAKAEAEQAKAVELFRSVPTATDKRAAFNAARAQARVAVRTLKQARVTLRNAVLDLRAIANGLKGAQG